MENAEPQLGNAQLHFKKPNREIQHYTPNQPERQTSVQRVGLWDQGAAALGRRGAHPNLQHRVMEFFPSPYKDALWKTVPRHTGPRVTVHISVFAVNMPLEHVCLVAQSCPTLYDPMVCSLPDSSGLLQARTLEQVAISYSRDLSDPGIEPASLASPALAGRLFTTSATWEALVI